MKSPLGRMLVAVLALLSAASCQGLFTPKPAGKSPLGQAQMSNDCCVLDVFFVNVPFGAPGMNDDLWREIDEQRLPADLRHRLGCNGFRIGVVGGQVPLALSKLMELNETAAPTGEIPGTNVAEMAEKPRVSRRHIQAKPGIRNEINASDIYEQLPVIFASESNGIGGETYEQAQGVLVIKTYPQPDGQVRLEVTPEVQHGQPKSNFVLETSGGVGHIEFSRPKRVFTELVTNAMLTPGSMLVLCSLPTRPGSLGHQFFTDNGGRPMQKVLIIRLSGTHNADLFDPGEPLKLPEK